MKPSIGLLICISLLMICSPVLAINSTISASGVSQYSVVAPSNYVIYQIIIDPVPMGTNQSHVLNYNGANFLLTIGSAQSYGIFNDFDISLTYPNGSVSSKHVSTTRISGGKYKTTIQPVFSQAQSVTNAYFTIDLEIGLSPVSAEFNTQPAGWLASNAIPFSSASGNLGSSTNVFCQIMTLDEFQNNVVKYNPGWGLQNLGDQIFRWTYSMVLGFLNQIPVIGPLAVSFITISSVVLPGLMFWVGWIVDHWQPIVLSVETLIIMIAVINTGKKGSLSKFLKNLYSYNIAFVLGIFWLFKTTRNWIGAIIDWIVKIVQSLH